MGILSQLEAATIVHIKICKDSTRPPPSTPNAARPGPSYVAGWTAAAPAAAVSPTLQAPKGTEERHQDDSRSSARWRKRMVRRLQLCAEYTRLYYVKQWYVCIYIYIYISSMWIYIYMCEYIYMSDKDW